ncbi:MAG: MMPL family transporter [Acidimicrobiia bacterium]|nr:MMPL family transporter [Acidimicrobiia bacterium]
MHAAPHRTTRLTSWLADRATAVIITAMLVTAILALPFLTMEPTESASQEPPGPVFEARDQIEDEFASSVFTTFTIVEDRNGDILRAEPLRALLAAQDALRQDPELGPTLFTYFDATDQAEVVGMRSIADIIDERLDGGLAAASDESVKAVAAQLISDRGVAELGLSAATTRDAGGMLVAPAAIFPILSDDTVLGFGGAGVRLGTDTASEEYSRSVIEAIRADGASYSAWGVANDVNLTAAEQGEAAGPFIGFTILAVLLVVGFTFRSYWVLAVTGGALAALIIWLQGISNLIGLKDDLILSLIVPIAMISFGVDFTFHAVGRYREARLEGRRPRAAFSIGIAAVAGALVLALASDSGAFLANTVAPIESIYQFGLGAAIALVAAFVLLGIVTPLAVMKIEEKVGSPAPTRRSRIAAIAGSGLAGSLAMTSVLLSVFILPAGGLVALAVYLVAAVWLPYRLARPGTDALHSLDGPATTGRGTRFVGAFVTRIAHARRPVLAVVAVATVAAALLAVRVPTEFDVKDFFAPDTDFVVGLDKLDEHGGAQAGEPAAILVDADLTDPSSVASLQSFVTEFEQLDSDRFGRVDDGRIDIDGGVLEVIREVWASPAAQAAIAGATGVTLSDVDGDGVPDTSEQLSALYGFTRQAGVPFDAVNLTRTPDGVRSVLSESGGTVLQVPLPGSRQVENISGARSDAAPLVAAFNSELSAIDSDATVTFTGSPIARQEALDAISQALRIGLPIAVLVCLLIAATFMRSIRFALVSIVPILIVVTWLYALMFAAGFAINLVTATIGAVSIGIGIDFAIHFTMRYREELDRSGVRDVAVRAAAEGTGVALIASAISSMLGFAILAFAPMPLFASYGLLTAVMIAMAAAASLLVLPSLLVLVTRDAAEPTVLESALPDVA